MSDEIKTPKPGYLTTEWYLSLATTVVGLAYSSGLISSGSTAEKIAGLATSLLATLGYTVARGITKAAASK